MDSDQNKTPDLDDANSLESPQDGATPAAGDNLPVIDATGSDDAPTPTTDDTSTPASAPAPKTPDKSPPVVKNFIRKIWSVFNIYLVLFVLVLIAGIVITIIAIEKARNANQAADLTSQSLTQDALNKIAGSDSKIGDPKQTLTVESNAIFSGKVLIRDGLDVAGPIKVGGALTLPGITVAGTANFDQVNINNLSISGNTSIQGQLSVQKNLSVSGGAAFGGPISAPQISIDTLQLNKDLQLNRHIDAGGGTPKVSNGNALGSGGTVSISGTDTAGTVTINVGGGPGGGTLAVITFNVAFNQTPHIVITPVGSGAAALNYYITRSATGFTIATASPPGAGTSFSFDYVAVD